MMRVCIFLIISFIATSYTFPTNPEYVAYSDITPTIKAKQIPKNKEEWILLARLVQAEAGNQSDEGRQAVADVVVHISTYKNWTIKRTIYDRGRFDGISSKWFNVTPSEECMEAARKALCKKHIIPYGVFYFHNPEISTDKKWVDYISKYPYKKIGDHLFCYHPKYYAKNRT